MLKEFMPNLAFIITESQEAKQPVYLAEVNIKGVVFVAKGPTKKCAKNKVSEQILTNLYGMDFTAAHDAAAAASASNAAIPVMDEEAQKLAERVMVLVMERFYSLTNMGLANTAKRKVLAGIVMTVKEVNINTREPGWKNIDDDIGIGLHNGRIIETMLFEDLAQVYCSELRFLHPLPFFVY